MSITKNEAELIAKLTQKLTHYRSKNSEVRKYYEAKNILEHSEPLPAKIANIRIALSWGKSAVDVVAKRIVLNRFNMPENIDVSKTVKSNKLVERSQQIIKDALLYGVGYVLIGSGDTSIGEPETLVTFEHPDTTVSISDNRTGRISSLLKVIDGEKGFAFGSLYLPNETINFQYVDNTTTLLIPTNIKEPFIREDYIEISREIHNNGYIPAVKFVNNPVGSLEDGESEITRSIKFHTDAAIMQYLDGSIASMLYATPQRALLGVDIEKYTDADGAPLDNLTSYLKKLWLIPQNSDGANPTAFQFPTSEPTPFIKWIQQHASAISGETGIPLSRLGYPSANPMSYEAIRAEETELVRNSKLRMNNFGSAWKDVIKFIIMQEYGTLVDGYEDVEAVWDNPEIQTYAAKIDSVTKLIAAGVFHKGSRIMLSELGYTETQIDTIIKDQEAADKGPSLISNIAALAASARSASTTLSTLDSLNNTDNTNGV